MGGLLVSGTEECEYTERGESMQFQPILASIDRVEHTRVCGTGRELLVPACR